MGMISTMRCVSQDGLGFLGAMSWTGQGEVAGPGVRVVVAWEVVPDLD